MSIKRSTRFRPRLELLEDRTVPTAPSADEQYMLELINRMRLDPTNELQRILDENDPDVNGALSFFNVNMTLLAQQFAGLTAVQPLAWHDALGTASEDHSQLMLDRDEQSHQLPGEPALGARATNAGYVDWNALGENVFAFTESVFHGHAAFAIDWGFGPTGIQAPPGHRNNIMSNSFREIGIGIVNDGNPNNQTGPLLTTQDFGNRFNFGNPYLLGVVYNDADGDSFYTPGEGLSGVNIVVSGTPGTFNATTGLAGGYQVHVPAGTYTVMFSGGGLTTPIVLDATVANRNVKLDATPNGVAATLRFSSATYAASEAGGSATITVSRTGDLSVPVSVNYQTGGGSAVPGQDYDSVSGTLDFAADEVTKTFTIPINDDGDLEGPETVGLTLPAPSGGVLGSPVNATLTIADNEISGSGTFTDQDGDRVTIALTGAGFVSLSQVDPDGDGRGAIDSLSVSSTNPLTDRLTITVKKAAGGDGFADIGRITGSGLKNISAKTANLIGTGINLTGYLGGLTVRDISNGADVSALGTATQKTTLKARVIGDGTTIDLDSAITSLLAARFGNGAIVAPSLTTLQVTGNKPQGIVGDFAADVTLTGDGLAAGSILLNTARIAGTTAGATFTVAGNVGTFKSAAFIGSRFFVGFTPTNALDPMQGGTFDPALRINSFKVTGLVGSISPAFADSFVAAATIKNGNLKSAQTNNGGQAFGVLAQVSIGSLTVGSPSYKFDPVVPPPPELGDFRVALV